MLEASRPEKRRKLSATEWLSLLDCNVVGRKVTKAQRANLRSTLDLGAESPRQQQQAQGRQVSLPAAAVLLKYVASAVWVHLRGRSL